MAAEDQPQRDDIGEGQPRTARVFKNQRIEKARGREFRPRRVVCRAALRRAHRGGREKRGDHPFERVEEIGHPLSLLTEGPCRGR